ncbi:MAG TPA: hypothetical protein VI318_14165 [Baekduia sp.]
MSAAAREAGQRPLGTLRLGLIAAPGAAHDLARDLASKLPEALRGEASSAVEWEVPLVADAFAADARLSGVDMIDRARERMQREGWHLAVCVTDLPLRNGRRPVVADASATHGVAILSLPALGAARMRRRALQTILQLLDGLMAERLVTAGERGGRRRRSRVDRRLAGVAATAGSPDDDVRFVAGVLRGNVRLLLGMVAANRPWRLAVGLSRALAGALGAAAFSLVTSDIWQLADSLGPGRLVVLTVLSVGATIVTLIVAHELWERSGNGLRREQAVLFNAATTITVALGVLVLYAALFAIALGGAWLIVADGPFAKTLGHPPSLSDYVRLVWLVSSLSMVGGALGGGLESDETVRQAAYGYHPDPDAERELRHAPGDEA